MQYPFCHEIDTRTEDALDSLIVAGVHLEGLKNIAMVLRHQKYEDNEDTVYFFGKEDGSHIDGPQVFVHIYSLPICHKSFNKELAFYEGQKKGFLLDNKQKFDDSMLALSDVPLNYAHKAFQTRDGATRRRIVHVYECEYQAVLVVFSVSSVRFMSNMFFEQVTANVKIK